MPLSGGRKKRKGKRGSVGGQTGAISVASANCGYVGLEGRIGPDSAVGTRSSNTPTPTELSSEPEEAPHTDSGIVYRKMSDVQTELLPPLHVTPFVPTEDNGNSC